MKKYILMALLSISSVAAAFAQTPEQIIKKFYPKFSIKNQCYMVEKSKEQGSYCMKLRKEEVRDTAQGKLMYLVYGGNHFDFLENKEDGSHADIGLVGIFILKETSKNNWELLASKPKEEVGSFGNAPDRWSLHEFGTDKWGFITKHNDVHQGIMGGHYVLFHHDGGKKIGTSWLGESYSNDGFYGDKCESRETKKERVDCLNNILSGIDTRIKILKNKSTVNGFYPIQITVNGFKGKKKYQNQNYIVSFDQKEGAYIAPKEYPLSSIDY